MTGSIPAHNTEAEMATLGSMMIDETGKATATARRMLTLQDFYRPNHAVIFKAILDLQDAAEPNDLLTLSDALRKENALEDIGGAEYLMALVNTVPTAANIEHYCKIVKRHSGIKQLDLKTTEFKERLKSPDADPKALMSWLLSEVDQLSIESKRGLVSFAELQPSYWALLELRKELADAHGWRWGLPTLDSAFGGCFGAQMVVLKGQRGSGKTHIAVHSAMRCVAGGKAAAVFSMEMSTHQLMDRITAYVSGVNSLELRKMREELWEPVSIAMGNTGDLPIYIDDESGLTVSEMRAECEVLQSQGVDLGLVVIDFAELIGGPSLGSREQELATIARGLRQMSKQLNCTVLLLSQVNSQGGERWSQAIGNVADLILCWHKDDSVLHLEKNRFGPEPRLYCGIDKTTSAVWEVRAEEVQTQTSVPDSFHKYTPWG